jgi:hypothetical protein
MFVSQFCEHLAADIRASFFASRLFHVLDPPMPALTRANLAMQSAVSDSGLLVDLEYLACVHVVYNRKSISKKAPRIVRYR